jgi:hypothetical protein
MLSKTIMSVYGYTHHWIQNVRTCLKPLLFGHQIGLQSGDIEFAMHNLIHYDLVLFLTAARPLGILAVEVEEHCEMMSRWTQKSIHSIACLFLQTVKNIHGDSADLMSLSGIYTDEEDFNEGGAKKQLVLVDRVYKVYKLQLAYLFGYYQYASKYAESSSDFGTATLLGHILVQRHHYFRGMTAIALFKKGVNKRKHLGIATWVIKSLEKWTRNGSHYCLHMTHLLEAEIRAAKGKLAEAVELYKVAIQSANRGGFLQDKALAHERAGIFHLELGHDAYWASYHLECAIECYNDWDAQAKVSQLVEKYGSLVGTSVSLLTDPDRV